MSIFTTIKSRLALREKGDYTLPLSKLAQLWDNGLKLVTGAGRHKPARPYSQVELVWICVNLLIDVSTSIQLMLSTDKDEIVESGPLYDFLFNNPNQPYTRFLEQTLGFYSLFRQVYWVYEDMDLQVPTRIRVVGPRQMEPLVKDDVLLGYKLRSGRKTYLIDPDYVYSIRNFNPYDEFRGCGPLNAGDLTISASYQSMQHIDSSLANGARLSLILSTPPGVRLQDEEAEKLRREFRSQQGGALNSGKAFLANGGLEVHTVNQTMAELQMAELSALSDKKICSLFGVPPEIVGLNSEAQYAHGPATQRLVLYGAGPLLSTIGEAIDAAIINRFRFRASANRAVPFGQSTKYLGSRTAPRTKECFRATKRKALQSGKSIFAWFDIDSHPAIQEMLRTRSEHMLKFLPAGVPLNQIIRAGDLPFEEVPWGDEWWTEMSKVPASWLLDAGPESIANPPYEPEEEPEAEPEEKPEKSVLPAEEKAKMDRIWDKHVRSWHPLEREMVGQLRTFFLRQRRELSKQLKAAWADNKSADRVKAAADIIARVTLDLKREDDKLRVINRVAFERAAKLGAAQTIAETTGAAGKELTEQAAEALGRREIRAALARSSRNITSVNRTTQRRVARTLQEGLDKGEGLKELTDRLEGVLDGSRARAQTTARTQVAGAVESGRYAGLKKVGAKLKRWLTARDENVRAAHRTAEQTYAAGIPVDEPFVLGSDALMYPGDPGGSPANIINCRCLLLALYSAAGKTLDLDYYDRIKFVSWSDLKTD